MNIIFWMIVLLVIELCTLKLEPSPTLYWSHTPDTIYWSHTHFFLRKVNQTKQNAPLPLMFCHKQKRRLNVMWTRLHEHIWNSTWTEKWWCYVIKAFFLIKQSTTFIGYIFDKKDCPYNIVSAYYYYGSQWKINAAFVRGILYQNCMMCTL